MLTLTLCLLGRHVAVVKINVYIYNLMHFNLIIILTTTHFYTTYLTVINTTMLTLSELSAPFKSAVFVS